MELLRDATIIMSLGMLVVFFVLFLVIQGVQLSARIIHHFEGEPQAEAPARQSPETTPGAVAAAIAVAIQHFQQK